VPGRPHELLAVLRELEGPIRAVYKAGPTGYWLMRARHRLGKFLLRRERYFPGPGRRQAAGRYDRSRASSRTTPAKAATSGEPSRARQASAIRSGSTSRSGTQARSGRA
jgi:hypothetical protein